MAGTPAHGHAGLVALALNLAGVAAGTLACNRLGIRAGADLTGPADYTADEDDPTVQQLPELVDGPLPYRARHAR
ncbi:MAG TPA: hypothetical protein VGR98_18855 [Streptosporangiaceae bacterium]|nr:hypothetical protein [Streptosporangiaceae bacterium]